MSMARVGNTTIDTIENNSVNWARVAVSARSHLRGKKIKISSQNIPSLALYSC